MNNRYFRFRAIHALGVLAALEGRMQPSATLFGALDKLSQDRYWGIFISSLCIAERREYEQALAAARAGLGDAAFSAAWEAGRAQDEEQVWQYAVDIVASAKATG